MKYLSICSGVDSCSLAWTQTPDGKGLGWEPVGFSEIEKFPSAVLKHHYPDVPNLGDMTRFREWPDKIFEEADLIVGGTPCQAFSHAGKRRSLDDERGNLTLTYTQLINHADSIRIRAGKPRPIVLWENVPGVLNTPDNALGCLFSELSGEDCSPNKEWSKAGRILGRGRRVAWCVLDSQYFGVPQRRRRVFALAIPSELVDDSSIPDPAAILSIGTCLRGDSPARPQQGKDSPSASGRGSEGGHWEGGGVHPTLNRGCEGSPGYSNEELFSQGGAGLVPGESLAEPLQEIAPTLTTKYADKYGYENQHINGGAGLYVRDVAPTVSSKWAKGTSGPSGNEHHNLVAEAKWWDGSDVAPTQLTNSHRQFMPDEGKLNAIVEPKPQAFYSNQSREMPPGEDLAPPLKVGGQTAAAIPKKEAISFKPKFYNRDNPKMEGKPNEIAPTMSTDPTDIAVAAVIPIQHQAIRSDGEGKGNGLGVGEDGDPAPTLNSTENHAICIQNATIDRISDAGPGGKGTSEELSFTLNANAPHAVAFNIDSQASNSIKSDNPHSGSQEIDKASALTTFPPSPEGPRGGNAVVSFTASEQANSYAWENKDTYPTLTAQQPNDTSNLQQGVRQEMVVRRLTPVECERLMGFPDNYTQIPWKGKPAEECPDGPRYKACGNSMVVPVMRWLGERIQAAVED